MKTTLAALLAACALALPAARAQAPAAPVIEQVRAHREGLAVWWMGNAGWLIKSGGLLFATDLDLEPAGKVQAPPVTARELAGELDILFVTHQHGDHCHIPTIRALAAGDRTLFVLPQPCLKQAAKLNIPQERIVVPEPRQPFEVKGMRVEPTHAIHGNQDFTVLTREPEFIFNLTHNCGYVFNTAGKRLFHPGDSVLTEEHLALKSIDVLFVSPTVHNMYVDRSMILINRLEPAYIFPQHFETYRVTDENAFWTRGYPDELKLRLSAELRKRYHKLRQGERFEIR
jgi:L-ascorbate metabolism protein UlaG (beta-lactamase superfamily)